MPDLLSIEEALSRILEHFTPLANTSVRLSSCQSRVLAKDICAGEDFPLFSNSSMDGYAVQAKDTAVASTDQPLRLVVTFDIPAGTAPVQRVESGQAARIMTGAPLPDGADSVIPVEDTYSEANMVWLRRPCRPGENIRAAGSDIHKGQTVLHKGRILQPQDVGVLAALGLPRVPVVRRPRVAIISSGDELIEPGWPLTPGKLRDSNTYMLTALAEAAGGNAIRLGVAPDQPDKIKEKFEQAILYGVHLILTSAGVSVGIYDYVRQVIESEGELDFWRVNMRPGKPLAFGSYKGTPVIGLPGNPVSAYVGFQVFARPAIAKLCGKPARQPATISATLSQEVNSDGRQSFLRGVISVKHGKITAELVGGQSSGDLFSLTRANALLIIPSGVKSLPAGSQINAWLTVDELQ